MSPVAPVAPVERPRRASRLVRPRPATGPTPALKAVAVVACLAAGVKIDVLKGITPSFVVLVALAPAWWPLLRRFAGLRVLLGATALAVAGGLVLAWYTYGERAFDFRLLLTSVVLLTATFAAPAVLVWATTVLPVEAVASWCAAGGVATSLYTRSYADNPWKYAFAVPTGVLLLAAVSAWQRRRRGGDDTRRPGVVLPVAALLVLGVVSIGFDYRSMLGFALLVSLLLVWQRVKPVTGRRIRPARSAFALIGGGVAIYLVATQLFVGGFLGSEIQQESQEQLAASGSLLLGGRPEWSATVELMAARPGGYGFGAIANSQDLQRATAGFVSIGVDASTGYVNYISYYMLTDGFQLHSVAADIWATCGVFGLLLALVAAVLVGGGIASALSAGRADALTMFAGTVVLWDLAFAPIYSSTIDLTIGLMLAVVALTRARAARLDSSVVRKVS